MRTLEFQLGELLQNLRRNGVLTLAAVMTVMTALSILAIFYVLGRNLERLLDEQARKAQISAFLADGLTDAQLAALRQQLTAVPGVQAVEYVSSEAALERLLGELDLEPEQRELLTGKSRLPAKFAVRTTEPGGLAEVAAQLRQLPGVEDVRYGEEIVGPLNELKRRFERFGWAALVILGVATCGIISNAIRLTIYARRREIRIMQLVGATDGFVRTPFLLEGLFHGVVGGLLALAVTAVLYGQVRAANAVLNPWLRLLELRELLPVCGPGLLLLGMLFGAGSSLLSMRQFLREA